MTPRPSCLCCVLARGFGPPGHSPCPVPLCSLRSVLAYDILTHHDPDLSHPPSESFFYASQPFLTQWPLPIAPFRYIRPRQWCSALVVSLTCHVLASNTILWCWARASQGCCWPPSSDLPSLTLSLTLVALQFSRGQLADRSHST